MTYNTARAPFLRRSDKLTHMTADVLITLVALCIFSAFYYGFRPVLLVLVGMATAMLCETIICLLLRRRPSVTDGTAAVTGALIGMMMSPLSPYWLPAVAAAFAIVVVKMPFGGTGRNVFNPAAAGIAVVTQCFSARLFTYPDPSSGISLPLSGPLGSIPTELSPAALIHNKGTPQYPWYTLLSGDFAGPIGATAVVVLAACLLYLFIRRTVSPLTVLPYLVVCALIAAVFPRTAGSASASVALELCSGYLLFGGIFLLTDPVTSPRYWLSRIVYGVLAGILVMTLRHVGRFEEGVCFAILLVNAIAPMLDRWCWRAVHFFAYRKEAVHS